MHTLYQDASLLRQHIRSIIYESDKKNRSAGVVILKRFDGIWKVLILKDTKGRFDITKGLVDDGETFLDAAVREASEEAGIFLEKDNFLWGFDSLSYGKGCAFVAATTLDPFIVPNPKTNELEHTEWNWLSFKEAKDIVIDYLKPAIIWAETKVSSHSRKQ
jgi:8-oxo-dGTP pyrophosphatase MutT (NUDIX family)